MHSVIFSFLTGTNNTCVARKQAKWRNSPVTFFKLRHGKTVGGPDINFYRIWNKMEWWPSVLKISCQIKMWPTVLHGYLSESCLLRIPEKIAHAMDFLLIMIAIVKNEKTVIASNHVNDSLSAWRSDGCMVEQWNVSSEWQYLKMFHNFTLIFFCINVQAQLTFLEVI